MDKVLFFKAFREQYSHYVTKLYRLINALRLPFFVQVADEGSEGIHSKKDKYIPKHVLKYLKYVLKYFLYPFTTHVAHEMYLQLLLG
jgi:hypothetical protein